MASLTRRTADRLVEAMAAEAHRAKTELKAPGHRRPYFVSYLLRDVEHHWFDARFGSLFAAERRQLRRCFADVRLGSYRTDHVRDGGLSDNSTKAESYGYSSLPIGGRLDGVVHALWQLTEARYREAAEDFLDKRAESLHYRDENERLAAFERRDPLVDRSFRRLPAVDADHWTRFVESASAIGRKAPGVYGCEVELTVRNTTRVFVSTEGSVVVDRQPLWQLIAVLDYASEAGVTVPWNLSWFVTDPTELPPLAELKKEMKRAFAAMRRVAEADTLRAYSGPVLLDPVPAGLLMHEAIGHRLEGNRLLSPGEGQTFRGALGHDLLPEMLSLRDDPTMTHFEGKSLVGHYRVDDEGVPAAATELVERGRIRGYLSTRAGIARRHHSNGHARNESFERPISRMGVTLVEASDPVSDAELERRLLAEAERRGLPFGIHVRAADSGETATKSYDFQAFLGQIRAAERVYLDGRREPVRDVSFVGTPLNAVRGVIAAGERREADNSYCGAESGAVPVSTISPSLLVESLELQSSARSPNAPHTYPLPWDERREP
ncbi:MAG TPA: metallopeptidase TldD-related protein [Sandaracinaceae bacterium LLY-WYZ-13_1]|nr:metallopeptidase TldD-related protein [Sandaracinaceae bacterium LLY-WYZ-13_1]